MKRYTLHTSDPMGSDFALVDEDGNKIEGVYEFVLRGEVNEPMRAEIYLIPQGVNAAIFVGEVNFTCPSCGDIVYHKCEPQTLSGQFPRPTLP